MARKSDLERLLRKFEQVPKTVRKAILPSIEKGADELVSRMKFLAPVDDKDGGELRDSVRKEPGPVPLSVTVTAGGPTTTRDTPRGPFDYALAVEFGTQETPAQPFFWPSHRMMKQRVRRRVDRAISKAVKEEWGKQ